MLKTIYFLCALVATAVAAKHRGPLPIQQGTFLSVEGTKFVYGADEVYLSGTNAHWFGEGNDFGNNQWDTNTGAKYTAEIIALGEAGGNTIRVVVHVYGENNPQFDSEGFVVGTDEAGTLVSDLRKFLDVCQMSGVFANLVLWDGTYILPGRYRDLFYDDAKLQSYIDNALVPMVNGLRDHPALAAWEVITEPECACPRGASDPNPCYDFVHLDQVEFCPGLSEDSNVDFRNVLRFVNWISDAIHSNDPKVLVSVGAISHFATCESSSIVGDPVHLSGFNHYKDSCLIDAGGRPLGTMDFYQFQSYPGSDDLWQFGEPFTGYRVEDYEMDAPLVVAEFPSRFLSEEIVGVPLPGGATTEDLVEYLYTNDFNGGWSSFYGGDNSPAFNEDILNGVRHLAGRTDHGVIDVEIN